MRNITVRYNLALYWPNTKKYYRSVKMTPLNTIATKAVNIRQALGFTQIDVAGMANVSAKSVVHFEQAKATAETQVVSKILSVLGIEAPLITHADLRGKTIRQTRKQMGMTLQDVAGMTNTSSKYLSAVENGKGNLRIGQLLSLLSALGINPLTSISELEQ